MSRCKSCNKPLEYGSLKMTKEDGTPEDFCSVCREKSRAEYNYQYDHQYEHQSITEGLSEASKKGYYYDWYE